MPPSRGVAYRSLLVPFLSVLVPIFPGVVSADVVISFSGETTDDRGTGFGSVLHGLGVQQNDTESGSVTWNGTADVNTGDAVPTSDTISVQQLFAAGANAADNGFDLVFGIDESGSGPPDTNVTIEQFTLFLTDGMGNAIPDVGAMSSLLGVPLTLSQIGSGMGAAGWVFDVRFTPTQWALFTADPANRIGMSATISGTSNGPEDFYVGASTAAVPEPSSFALFGLLSGIGLVGNAVRRRNRRATAA